MANEKVKFYWQTMLGAAGSTLTPTNEAAGFPVSNIYNMLEINRWKALNAADPQSIVFDAGGEQVTNKDFEAGNTTGWTLSVGGTAAATFSASTTTPIAGTRSCLVDITAAGGAAWEIQVYQNVTLTPGKTYQLFFKAKAAAARNITVSVFQSTAPYTTYLNKVAALTAVAASYVYTFVAPATVIGTSRIYFNLGGDINNVWLDDIGFSLAYSADYIAASGHNFGSIGGYAILGNSPDGVTYTPVITMRRDTGAAFVEEARVVVNGGFEVWSEGTSSNPTGWYRTGAGSTTVRNAAYVKDGLYSAALTRAGAEVWFSQRFTEAALEYYNGRTITFGCWVYATVASQVRLIVYDGVTYSFSSYHTGTAGWEFLTITKTFSASSIASNYFGVNVQVDGTVYCDGYVAREGTSVSAGDLSDSVRPGGDPRRFWRVRFTGHTVAPEAAICIWGNKTELKRALLFDPHEEEIKANVVKGPTGYVLGIHNQYRERRMDLKFANVDSSTYQKLKEWWDGSGLKNFFVAWDKGNHPDDVFLMMPDPRFRNPFIHGGTRREVSISLTGRREDV